MKKIDKNSPLPMLHIKARSRRHKQNSIHTSTYFSKYINLPTNNNCDFAIIKLCNRPYYFICRSLKYMNMNMMVEGSDQGLAPISLF